MGQAKPPKPVNLALWLVRWGMLARAAFHTWKKTKNMPVSEDVMRPTARAGHHGIPLTDTDGSEQVALQKLHRRWRGSPRCLGLAQVLAASAEALATR